MKKIVRITTVSLFLYFLFYYSGFSQENREDDLLYLNKMEKALKTFDLAETYNSLLEAENEMEKIVELYPEKWQPTYYVTLCKVNYLFYREVEDKIKMSEEAKNNLQKLSAYADADKSEIQTLWGLYYNALIVINPQENAMKYSGLVIKSYEEAIKLNPENPRPVCLLALYENYLPQKYRSNRDVSQEKEKAKKLFEKEKSSIEKPYWGYFYLNMIN